MMTTAFLRTDPVGTRQQVHSLLAVKGELNGMVRRFYPTGRWV